MADPVPQTVTGKYGILQSQTLTGKYGIILHTTFTGRYSIRSLIPLHDVVKVSFTKGSVEFQVDEVVTGSVSRSYGTVYAVVLESGSYAAGTAAGYVLLKDVRRG